MNRLKQIAKEQNGIAYIEQIEEWLESIEELLNEKQFEIDGNMSLHNLYSDGFHEGIGYAIDLITKGYTR